MPSVGGRVRHRRDLHRLLGLLPNRRVPAADHRVPPFGGRLRYRRKLTGSSASCPPDRVMPVDSVCRPSAGPCDAPEVCGGVGVNCPPDQFQPSTTVCRASAGVCDAAETCSGSSASCPPDSFLPSTAVCRPSTGVCDPAENCPGTAAACPADLSAPNGTSCNDGNACTQTDTCQGGTCTGANPVTCAPQEQCRSAAACNSSTGTCAAVPAADGTACDDGDRCTVGDSCHAGTCLPGAATGCTGTGATNFIPVIDLGSEQGWSYASDINNNGEVIGSDVKTSTGIYQFPVDGSRAFIWTASGGIDYLPWPGTFSYPSAINDGGVISGSAGFEGGPALPFRYDPLNDAQPVYQSVAGNGGGINSSGVMTGGGYYLTPGGGDLEPSDISHRHWRRSGVAVGGWWRAAGLRRGHRRGRNDCRRPARVRDAWNVGGRSVQRRSRDRSPQRLVPAGTGWNLTGAG